jgi:hypothetical protein
MESDDQQERQKAYVAGLITGEGCFCFGVSNYKNNLRIKPIFQIKMADLETMQIVIDYFQRNDLALHVREDGLFLRVRSDGMKRCKRIIEHFSPYLTGTKLRAANVVLDFIKSRETKTSWDGYDSIEVGFVETLRSINGVRNGKKNPISNPQRLYVRSRS